MPKRVRSVKRKRRRTSRAVRRPVRRSRRSSRFSSRKPAAKRARRVHRVRRGRVSTASISKAICPVNSFSFSLAQRVNTAAAVAGTIPCVYWTASRANNVSLGYPNFTDTCTIGLGLTGATTATALARSTNIHQPVTSIDVAFTSFRYREVHTLSNTTNAQITLSAYYITARRDIPFKTWNTAGGGFETYQLTDWLGAAFARIGIVSLSVVGTDSAFPSTTSSEFSSQTFLNIDAQFEPHMAELFKHYFRIRRVKRIKLRGGAIATVRNNCSRRIVNFPSDYKQLTLATQDWAYLDAACSTSFRKGAQFVLFKAVGQPVNSTLTPAAINFHSPSLDHVTRVEYKYQSRLKRGGIMLGGASYGLTNLIDPRFVSDDTDAVTTVVSA